MKAIIFGLFGLLSSVGFAQNSDVNEEFLPIKVEGKDAFMSTKTGEFTYREHSKTDPLQLKTTANGVVYTEITSHVIKKGETLSSIAKKNGVTLASIQKHNKINSKNLKIGTSIKIVKRQLVKSSSPVISYVGEERIIAALRPGESPGQFAPPPSVADVKSKVIETKKSEEKPSVKVYKVDKSVKNPIFGLDADETAEDEDSLDALSEAINNEVNVAKKGTQTKIQAKAKAKIKGEGDKAVAKVPKTELKDEIKLESKKDRLNRLKLEVQDLESELNNDAVSTLINEPKHVKTKENNKVAAGLKPGVEETTATKAKRVIASVKKTNEEARVEKTKEAKDAKDAKDVKDAPVSKTSENKSKTNFHKVVRGNTLSSIARQYNMTLKELIILNELKDDRLSVGQQLKVTTISK